jgi:molybdopterin-containing oxidoreductase family iron-sulfur binding subunit
MEHDRRGFIKIAGVSAIGLAGLSLAGRDGEAGESEPVAAGPRWAMVIDPRKCLKDDGCISCITACHRTHNVPSIPNARHEVKWIWKERFTEAFPDQEAHYIDEALTTRPVLVFCNHCDNPPCVRVCPTQATWRRPDGIVMMDWHRCIGCRYCVAGCPYGSRSFNWEDPRPYLASPDPQFPTRTKGVVEKCTLCEERLDKKQLPACVEACQEKAMLFGDLNDPESEVRKVLRSHFAIRRKPALGTNPAVYYLV